MTTSINEHTRDVMQSKPSTKAYEENWLKIFKGPCVDEKQQEDIKYEKEQFDN